MVELFKNRFRIQSARASWWDYGENGAYFITICTSKRKHYFGYVHGGEMNLSDIGRQAWQCWDNIPSHFPFVKLDEFIIMPNHLHGIIIIDHSIVKNDSTGRMQNPNICTQNDYSNAQNDNMDLQSRMVETQNFASLPSPYKIGTKRLDLAPPRQNDGHENKIKTKFGPQSMNVGSIIRGFKIGVTLYCKQNRYPFGWQSRFHDHIIRNDDEMARIRWYIINNPRNWVGDGFYS